MTHEDLTPGEIKMLRKIAESDFRSDADLTAPVWQPTETKEDRGYLGSLVKKGIASVDNMVKGEETCWLTHRGIDIYMQLSNTMKA